jgi:hypothetical protein
VIELTAINLLLQGTNQGVQLCVRRSQSYNLGKVLVICWSENHSVSSIQSRMVLLLNMRQSLANLHNPLVFSAVSTCFSEAGFVSLLTVI